MTLEITATCVGGAMGALMYAGLATFGTLVILKRKNLRSMGAKVWKAGPARR